MNMVRIGAGAGFSGDRIEPAVELAEHGDLDYLVFECLAERTIALAQQAKLKNPEHGYDPLLAERMQAVLPVCRAHGIRIVTNMGAANPLAAARKVAEVARSLGLAGIRIAAVTGDDVLEVVRQGDWRLEETGEPVAALGDRLVSANAYTGAPPIVTALAGGADIVVTGRTADPALFLAPLVHAFGWAMDDWTRLGRGTVVGHLLECAGQVTGGYFADPGCKDVPDLARLGFPLAEVAADGTAVITKVPGSGGMVTTATCKEQLLYEVHDPARYLTPDVAADFTGVRLQAVGPDLVRVSGGSGAARPDTLKVSVGYLDGWIGEGQVSYGGPGAVERARLAGEVVQDRLELLDVRTRELRVESIGVDALYSNATPEAPPPYEVRLRVAARTDTEEEATIVAHEVDALGLCGPSAGSIAAMSVREVLGVVSTFVPRELVSPRIVVQEVGA
jgi:hypothetical protein